MQKFVNILVALLAAYAIYFGIIVDPRRVSKMEELGDSDSTLFKHKDIIEEDYRRLNLRFEGRGKHIRRIQNDIADLREQLHFQVDSLGNKIEEVAFFLNQLEEFLREDIAELDSEIRTLRDDFTTYRRRSTRNIQDIQSDLTTIKDDIKALEEKISPPPEEENKGR